MALATLSIDLVAKLGELQAGLDKAGRIAEKDSARMSAAFNGVRDAAIGIGKGLIAGLSVRALAQFVTQTGEAGAAIQRLAGLSNATSADFQRYAFAARSVGIEQDKLSDILKDTQDKVGDFLTTGAGPLADFFERIAPQVGVTAEQFRNLGGKDALQLYVSSLEKANLSQSEMVFFLEAIASDSALLLPLLRNNGRGFQELGDKAERLGAVLSDKAVASAAQFDTNLKNLSTRVLGLARDISGPLIQALNDLFDISERGGRKGGGFLTGFVDQLEEDYVRAREIATREQLQQARPGFERAQALLAVQPDSIRAQATVAEYRQLEAAARGYREELQRATVSGFPQSNVAGGRGNIIPALAGSGARVPVPGKPARPERETFLIPEATGPGPFSSFEIPDALTAGLQALQQTDVEKIKALQNTLLDLVTLRGLDGDTPALAEAITSVTLAIDELNAKSLPAILDPKNDFLRSEKSAYDQSDEEIKAMLDGIQQLDDRTRQFLDNVQSGFGETLFKTLKGDFDNIGQLWGNLLLRMAAEAAAADFAAALGFGNAKGGNVAGLVGGIGSILGGLFGGGRAIGGPARRGQVVEVNELGGMGELFSAGGKQYLLPSMDGQVTPTVQRPGYNSGGPAGAGASGRGSVIITLAPQISIDSRSDQAQVAALVQAGMAEAQAGMWRQLSARGFA